MKQFYAILLTGLVVTSAHAQDHTVTWEEVLPIGSSYTRTDVVFPFLMDTTSGIGVTWNYTNIPLSSTATTTEILDPADTPAGTSFPSATRCRYTASNGSYSYDVNTPDSLTEIGYQYNATVRVYPDNYNQRVYPMSYGSTHSDHYRTSLSDFIGTTMWYAVIGSGTLMLPGSTNPNVLLVRSTSEFSYAITNYQWIDASTGATLMQLRPEAIEPALGWAVTSFEVGIPEARLPIDAAVNILPDGTAVLNYSSAWPLTYTVHDASGRALGSGTHPASTNPRPVTLEVPRAAHGLHVVSLTNGTSTRSLRFVIP